MFWFVWLMSVPMWARVSSKATIYVYLFIYVSHCLLSFSLNISGVTFLKWPPDLSWGERETFPCPSGLWRRGHVWAGWVVVVEGWRGETEGREGDRVGGAAPAQARDDADSPTDRQSPPPPTCLPATHSFIISVDKTKARGPRRGAGNSHRPRHQSHSCVASRIRAGRRTKEKKTKEEEEPAPSPTSITRRLKEPS